MFCPFCLTWNGDTVEGVSVSSDITRILILCGIVSRLSCDSGGEDA